MTYRSPLPAGWRHVFTDRADFGEAWHALARAPEHFYVAALRGHIRTLELRLEEGRDLLQCAARLARDSKPTVPDLARRFLLETYRLENALLRGSRPPTADVLRTLSAPVPAALTERYPELGFVEEARRTWRATVLLHAGECTDAAKLFARLLDESPGTRPEVLCARYTGLAACQQALGLTDAARRSLENAELAAGLIEGALPAGRAAANLLAFRLHLGDAAEANEWRGFIRHLRIPPRSQDLFLARAGLVLERGTERLRPVAY